MSEISNKRIVVVGVFIVIGLAFLVGGILMVGNLHETFKKKMTLVTVFENVNGLQKGNNVWFSGVKIGIVSGLRFYGESQVEVTMKIETNVQQYIRKDAKVKIGADGPIGNKILIIYGGTPAGGEVTEGDTLSVVKTATMDDMFDMLQENNKNALEITGDLKLVSKKLVGGEGTVGKLLNDEEVYNNINAATASLQSASAKAEQLLTSLNTFSAGLNKKGTLANQLTTDTVVFNSVKTTVLELQQIADTANLFITNLKDISNNPNTSVGVLLHDEEAGAALKKTLKNLESSSAKLDEDLEAAQHSFLLRGFFKKKAKQEQKDSLLLK